MPVIPIDPKDIGAAPADAMPETPDPQPQQPAEAVDAAQPDTAPAPGAGQGESLTDFIERLHREHGPATTLAPPAPAAAGESIMMRLWSRIEPELALVTDGKRIASDAEISTALRNNARSLGIALPADGPDIPPDQAEGAPAPGSADTTGNAQPEAPPATNDQADNGPAAVKPALGRVAAGTPAATPDAPITGPGAAPPSMGEKSTGQAAATPTVADQAKPGDPAAAGTGAAQASPASAAPPAATAPASTPGATPAAATPAAPAVDELKKSGFPAILSGNTISDPNLAALIKAKQAYHTAELERRYKRIMSDIRDKNKKLAELQARKGQEKQVLALQARLARRGSDAATAAAALLPALQAQRPLEQYFIGKNVNILVGTPANSHGDATFNNNGRAQFAKGVTAATYTIKGPDYKFATADDAAFDAIALARGVAGSLRENNERMGYIIKRADGTFGYEYPYRLSGNGKPFPRLYASGGDFEDRADPPPLNAVAMWHIHPIGNGGDDVKNVYFGPGDINAPWTAANAIHAAKFDAYLGSSDGGVRVVRNIRTYPATLDGGKVPQNAYQRVGPGYLLLR